MTEKTYPPLFKKKLSWELDIQKNETSYTIRTQYGQIGGKIQTKTRDICEGKAKRSIFEQAVLEANRMWANKKEKEGYVEDSADVKSVIIRPMLAQTYIANDTRKKKINFPCIAQPKWDGIRCIANVDSADGSMILQSRKGINFENQSHIRSELKHLFTCINRNSNTFYLDGELYSHDIPFEEISGLVRTKSNVNNVNKLFYVIYDCFDLSPEFCEQKYSDRLALLKDNIQNNQSYSFVTLCLSTLLSRKEDVDAVHDKFVSEGFEGLILRNANSIYELDKRSYDLQKYKKFQDAEFVITGFKEGVGVDKGLVIWQCLCGNRTFDVRPDGTHASRKKKFENGDKYIGKELTVKFQGLTQDGCPRFPVGKGIREDGI